jgi:hypothetical protein
MKINDRTPLHGLRALARWFAVRNGSTTVGACVLGSWALLSGCVDPVVDRALEKLGPEKGNVPPGPLHRPGQPCLLCHSEDGDADPFTVAGTVYLDPLTSTPVDNVAVTTIDAKGRSFTVTTNCAGNFFVRPQEFTPTFPIWLEMQGGTTYRSMESASYREGSCAGCHVDPAGPSSPGHVYLLDDATMETPPPSRCP